VTPLPRVIDVVPHRPPLLALEDLLDWTPGHLVGRMHVRAGQPFERDGRVNGVCTLEYMAQAVAACVGCEATRLGEDVRVGLIVACRSLRIERPFLPVGAALILRADRLRGSDNASLFRTEARCDGRPVAQAIMTLVHGKALKGMPPQG
jgi:predicted hotdog family 3-hydroxylacyl-ACP dehydratase